MTDREFMLRLAVACGIEGPASKDESFCQLVRMARSRRLTIEKAAQVWHLYRRRETERSATPGGLGAWTYNWMVCRRCILHEGRRRVVMGRGDVPCDLLIIGQAPGKVEDEMGEPFRGPAGRLFDRVLRPHADVKLYIANLVGCYPPRDRAPKAVEVEACTPRLDAIIETVRPWAVLLIGSQPLHHLMVMGLSKNRGRHLLFHLQRWTIPAVATWHPAGILRCQDPHLRRERMMQLRGDVQIAMDLARQAREIPF